ncbi:hypothetical protein [Staphylococcus epidermidis]|nr:hypothetical protein [Staphylococcus epidermidis]MCG1218131.1 hypothetical protein [Staphylococcus epidermidis]MCG1453694.1 hypothetical protein [Staphylococcus epidermidis]MCG2085716.1 hypothetical protein [Staphylococcus epidermidis]MCG7818720.1 hypothetical protein [Staphylococcus epidermidis]
MKLVDGFTKVILSFICMSVRNVTKVKREITFVLMLQNIKKVVAQQFE